MPPPRLPLARLAPDLPDRELLERYARQGDEQAFAAIVARHGRMVKALCRRVLGNDADADDAVQAVFLVLVRKAGSIRDRNGLANWLYGVAHNVARKAQQTRTRRAAKETQAASRANEQVTSDFAELLHVELEKLPAAYRAAVVVCDLEGQTVAAAAKQLGVPIGTVASRLARGRSRLAARLSKLGLSVSAGLVCTLLTESARATAVSFDPSIVGPHIHTLANEVVQTMNTLPKVTKLATVLTVGVLTLAAIAWGQAPPPRATAPKADPKPAEKAKGPSAVEVLDAAKKAADEIEEEDKRLSAWVNIAAEYALCGEKKKAKELFAAAAELDRNSPIRNRRLMWIAGRMARVGLAEDGAGLVGNNGATAESDRSAYAGWLAGTGEVKLLAKLADDCTGVFRSECLALLAAEQARLGKTDDAKKTVEEIPHDYQLVTALTALAVAQHKAKDPKSAADTLEAAAAAAGRLRAGGRPQDGAVPTHIVALAHASIGDRTAARDTAAQITHPYTRERALADIAWIEYDAGERTAAVKALDGIGGGFQADRVRAKVVRHQAGTADWKTAEATAKAITCVYWQVRAQQDLAVAYWKAGKSVDASKALAKAGELAGKDGENVVNDETGHVALRPHAMNLFYKSRAAMGEAGAAMSDIAKLESPLVKAYSALNVARGLRPRVPLEDDE
ncbi:MAG: sigma-70 family RNA polymerase sigma factor [Fimbriiglobus sp.]|nr:sigma-70 family RNA polymerase sigma factor [Fimbriiglobus sp.]